jgi:hypothetical protein
MLTACRGPLYGRGGSHRIAASSVRSRRAASGRDSVRHLSRVSPREQPRQFLDKRFLEQDEGIFKGSVSHREASGPETGAAHSRRAQHLGQERRRQGSPVQVCQAPRQSGRTPERTHLVGRLATRPSVPCDLGEARRPRAESRCSPQLAALRPPPAPLHAPRRGSESPATQLAAP